MPDSKKRVKIDIPPGVFTHGRMYTVGPRWIDAEKMRFVYGQPEVIPPYFTMTGTAGTTINDTNANKIRSIFSWYDLSGAKRAAYGTHEELWVTTLVGQTGNTHAEITPTASFSTGADPMFWSFDQWGEDLIANPRGQVAFRWDTSTGTGTPAAAISGSPKMNFVLVSPTTRHMIALGGDEGTGTIDPLMVQWSDQDDFTTWTGAPTNTAGSQRLTHGSKIVAGAIVQDEILIWTDKALYAMQFLGPPNTFGFRLIANDCGLVTQKAFTLAGGRVYWWGNGNKFFTFPSQTANGIEEIPCTIDLFPRTDQSDPAGNTGTNAANTKAVLAAHTLTWAHTFLFRNEIWFYYVKATASEITNYLIYNYAEKHWSCGTDAYYSGIDQGLDYLPIATNTVFINKETYVGGSASESWSVQSGAIELDPDNPVISVALIATHQVMRNTDAGDITYTFTLSGYDYPNSTAQTGTATITREGRFPFRVRGRFFTIKYSGSDSADERFRIGTNRLEIEPDEGQ